MASSRKTPPDFFEDAPIDPLASAIGPAKPAHDRKGLSPPAETKRKAGFYLTETMLERFNRKFYQLKLGGLSIENKSALLERALGFALDDLDKGSESQLLKKM